MARAKRTVRADARRRYRQTQTTTESEGGVGEAPAPRPVAAASAPSARPSFLAAFRQAYHPANIREDLPYLPSLLRHWSFWVPLLLIVGTGVLAAVAPGQPLVLFAYQTFVYPPALIVLFITGFFARRASYLLGAILGVVNVLVYGGLLLYAVRTGLAPVTSEQLGAAILNAIVVSPPSGVLFTSLAAWYRRFLYLSNPNRGRRPPAKGKPKPARSSGRPLLGR